VVRTGVGLRRKGSEVTEVSVGALGRDEMDERNDVHTASNIDPLMCSFQMFLVPAES